MQQFTASELRSISEGVHAMYCATSVQALFEQSRQLLRQLIPDEVRLIDERSFRTDNWTRQLDRLFDDAGARTGTLKFSPRGQFVVDLLHPHFARARQLLEAAPPVVRQTNPIGLTPREHEVLYWVSEGKTNSQIGLILNASARTIQKHLEHIFQKLGVETRTSATVRAIEMGMLATITGAMS
jgi:DNA-binding CsgD family transcriptional regulator